MMCGICGCAEPVDQNPHAHGLAEQAPGHGHGHGHGHEHVLPDGSIVRHRHDHHHGAIDPHLGEEKSRLIAVERNLLERNNANARTNRAHFAAHKLLVLNLVSSPGSGKTTLLTATAPHLRGVPAAVIEGDQQTDLDAARIREAGLPAVQINTGKGCHLEADQVGRAFNALHALENGVLFIENVGNLVCPASFDLGETHRVVIASVTEGDDKPLKYPDMFASADLLIVSKLELAGPCGSDVETLIANARKVRPGLPAICLSAKTGEGMERWIAWVQAARALVAAGA